MAYVQPSGVIQLFKGVRLDNRYMHTLYFASTSAQTAYFDTLVDPTLSFGTPPSGQTWQDNTAQTYSRPNTQTVRLHINADKAQTVSYMRFNNKRSGTAKWYYAFVLSIEYVNENVTDIVYEIDVMQTWFMQGGDIQPCMVLREHTNDDTFGTNLEAEPVGSSEYDLTELNVEGVAQDFSNYQVVMNTTEEPTGTADMIRDGVVIGTTFNYYGVTSGGMSIMKNEMLRALGSWDKNEQKADIVDLFMFPSVFTFGAADSYHSKSYHVYHTGRFNNYTPKNKKLFSYPYSSLYVTTNDGDNAMYRWEYFEGDITQGVSSAQFNVNATLTGGGMIEMHPASYNGVLENYDSKLVMNNFPKCSWNYDAYQAWVANGGQYKAKYDYDMIQKKGAIAIAQSGLSAVSSVANQGTQMASLKKPSNFPAKYGISGAVNAVQGVASIEQTYLSNVEARDKVSFEFKDARYEPNIIVGQQVANIAVGYKFLGFRFFNMHVRDDEAKRLDDFFSVYGYSVNKVKKPNLTGRSYWNFVKTEAAVISGNMPASSRKAIADIFNGGIFFWHTPANLGNFGAHTSHGTIDNPIV